MVSDYSPMYNSGKYNELKKYTLFLTCNLQTLYVHVFVMVVSHTYEPSKIGIHFNVHCILWEFTNMQRK